MKEGLVGMAREKPKSIIPEHLVTLDDRIDYVKKEILLPIEESKDGALSGLCYLGLSEDDIKKYRRGINIEPSDDITVDDIQTGEKIKYSDQQEEILKHQHLGTSGEELPTEYEGGKKYDSNMIHPTQAYRDSLRDLLENLHQGCYDKTQYSDPVFLWGGDLGKNLNQNEKEENKMSNKRRLVSVQLIDDDPGLDVEHSVVYSSDKPIPTEDSNDVVINETLMSKDIKGYLENHNKVRIDSEDIDILKRTGNSVKLRPVKLKDLRWVVV